MASIALPRTVATSAAAILRKMTTLSIASAVAYHLAYSGSSIEQGLSIDKGTGEGTASHVVAIYRSFMSIVYRLSPRFYYLKRSTKQYDSHACCD